MHQRYSGLVYFRNLLIPLHPGCSFRSPGRASQKAERPEVIERLWATTPTPQKRDGMKPDVRDSRGIDERR